MSDSPEHSPPHLRRTNTFPGHASLLSAAFHNREKRFPALERNRLAWLELVGGIIEHAAANSWAELNESKEIEELFKEWTEYLEDDYFATDGFPLYCRIVGLAILVHCCR